MLRNETSVRDRPTAQGRIVRSAVLAALALSACALHHVPAPPPGQPADVAAMSSVVARTRARPPHRGFPLAVAPVTVSYEPDRYPLGLRPEFAAAVTDLESKSGRIEPTRPAPLSWSSTTAAPAAAHGSAWGCAGLRTAAGASRSSAACRSLPRTEKTARPTHREALSRRPPRDPARLSSSPAGSAGRPASPRIP